MITDCEATIEGATNEEGFKDANSNTRGHGGHHRHGSGGDGHAPFKGSLLKLLAWRTPRSAVGTGVYFVENKQDMILPFALLRVALLKIGFWPILID